MAQVIIPAGVWQRTHPSDEDALVSCVVSPGFDFADFELEPVADSG
jgi:predicted cupin superfamily sugar epimerase